MNLVLEAYKELFGKEPNMRCTLKYSGRFKDYGANIMMRPGLLAVSMSKMWIDIDHEIQKGCMQELMIKIFKSRKTTPNIDLYNNFVKHLHIAIPKTKSHPILDESFNRVNERFFLGLVEKPNLAWGKRSTRTFGTYCFKTDMITLSTILNEVPTEYLDYVMFHELLHKQRKFDRTPGSTKTRYHDKKFKMAEQIFPNQEEIEKGLGKIATIAYRARSTSVAAKVKRFFKG